MNPSVKKHLKTLEPLPEPWYPAHLKQWYNDSTKYPLKEGIICDRKEFVYVFHNTTNNLFKIGITVNPDERIAAIQSLSGVNIGCPLLLELQEKYDERAIYIERLLHVFFHKKRSLGEWFSLDIKDLLAIRDLFHHIYGNYLVDDLKKYLRTGITRIFNTNL